MPKYEEMNPGERWEYISRAKGVARGMDPEELRRREEFAEDQLAMTDTLHMYFGLPLDECRNPGKIARDFVWAYSVLEARIDSKVGVDEEEERRQRAQRVVDAAMARSGIKQRRGCNPLGSLFGWWR